MGEQHEGNFDGDLLSPISELGFVRFLLADLHDDLDGKTARFRQLTDLSGALGSSGTMLPGAYTTSAAWREARTSFVQGNFVATVMLCQGLAEHVLAAHLEMLMDDDPLPPKISFVETLRRCRERSVISEEDAADMRRLMALRNPLSHFRTIDDACWRCLPFGSTVRNDIQLSEREACASKEKGIPNSHHYGPNETETVVPTARLGYRLRTFWQPVME